MGFMRIKLFVIALLASLSFTAVAENYIINQAYEIAVADLRLPGNIVGTVSFKDCDACTQLTISVTTKTRYVVNNRDVTLAKFKEAVNSIVDKKRNITTVIHHLESDTVVALHVVKRN